MKNNLDTKQQSEQYVTEEDSLLFYLSHLCGSVKTEGSGPQ